LPGHHRPLSAAAKARRVFGDPAAIGYARHPEAGARLFSLGDEVRLRSLEFQVDERLM
jgi:hypothetical protein